MIPLKFRLTKEKKGKTKQTERASKGKGRAEITLLLYNNLYFITVVSL